MEYITPRYYRRTKSSSKARMAPTVYTSQKPAVRKILDGRMTERAISG